MQPILEDFRRQTITESAAMQARYAEELSAVEDYRKGKGEAMSPIQKSYLAQMLENVDRELSRCKAKSRMDEATEPANIGDFRKFAFPIITAVYSSLIANDLVSVQPLKLKTGQVFFLDVIAGTSKNGVKKGDVLYGSDGAERRVNYAGETIEQEFQAEVAAGETTATFKTEFNHVRPGTVSGGFASASGAALLGEFTDDGKGKIVSDDNKVTGTIDYDTGNINLTLDTSVTATAVTPELSYEYNNEVIGTNGIPEVDLTIREITLHARSKKLRSLYNFDAAYDLQMSQGIDIDEVLLESCSQQLKFELDGDIINDLYIGAGQKSTWSKTKDDHITQDAHWATFLDELNACRNKIFQKTKRVTGNFVVLGTEAATIVEHFQGTRFKGAEAGNAVGPHFAGVLDGVTKVYKDPYLPEGAYLVGYKGAIWLDTGYVLGVYLPLYATNLIMLDDFVGRRGYATSNARRLLKPNYYVSGTITK